MCNERDQENGKRIDWDDQNVSVKEIMKISQESRNIVKNIGETRRVKGDQWEKGGPKKIE